MNPSVSECIRDAMQIFIPSKRIKHSEYSVVGWNDIVADKHETARRAFLEWVRVGKPKMGYLYEIMKRTRAQFKLALRYCRNNDEVLKSNALARNYLLDKRDFWKNVKNASKH